MPDTADNTSLVPGEMPVSLAEEKAPSPYWEKHNASAQAETKTSSESIPVDRSPSKQGAQAVVFPDSGPEPANAYYIEPPKPKSSASTRAGGAVTMAVGGAVTLIGIPMLILPGPGVLAVGGGIALMAKGAKDLLGSKNK